MGKLEKETINKLIEEIIKKYFSGTSLKNAILEAGGRLKVYENKRKWFKRIKRVEIYRVKNGTRRKAGAIKFIQYI